MEQAATLHRTAAFVRQDFLAQTSYRVQTLLSVGGLALTAVPVYFIARALQSTMAESIQNQGDQYFAFLIVGLAAQRLIWHSVTALPMVVGSGIRTGTLEALFSTPSRLPTLIAGMMSYKVLWGICEGAILLGAGWILGARFVPVHALTGLAIILLIVLAYVPFGLLAAAGTLAFRTFGPLLTVVNVGSVLLGGVYYPTHVIPSSIEQFSALIPLTYGLRALRQTMLEGMSIGAVKGDLMMLLAFILVLGGISVFVFGRSLRYARRSGSLAQY